MNGIRMTLVVAAFAGAAFFLAGGMAARAADRPMQDNPDPSRHYMFYMHGNFVEKAGPTSDYRYYEILDALEQTGLVVIGEARGKTEMTSYASKVASQVGKLIEAGVPAANITVAGHSKGGLMALMVAAILKMPEVRYGALAACGLPGTKFANPYVKFIGNTAADMKGTFLVMWEQGDSDAGACDEAMKAGGVAYENRMLTVGGGHHLFYTPSERWIAPLIAFAKGS